MQVLVTGAGGHIGAEVVSELIAEGNDVTGLVRSDRSADEAVARGAAVIRGDVTDLSLLRDLSAGVDAVVHLAFDNAAAGSGGIADAAKADMASVRAIGDGLAARGGTLLGIGVTSVGDAEADRRLAEMNPRVEVAHEILRMSERGIRPLLIGVPPVTHSDRDRSGFIPTLIGIARRRGVSGYVGAGDTRWPAVHTLDLATLIGLALSNAPSGSQILGAAEPAVRVRDIAEAIAGRLGIPARSIAGDEADEHFAPFPFMGYDIVMPTEPARRLLGWTPTHSSLLEDLAGEHYFAED